MKKKRIRKDLLEENIQIIINRIILKLIKWEKEKEKLLNIKVIFINLRFLTRLIVREEIQEMD